MVGCTSRSRTFYSVDIFSEYEKHTLNSLTAMAVKMTD